MGKKRVIEKSKEEVIQEGKAIEQNVQKSSSSKSSKRQIPEGRVYIFSSYNNTSMTLTDPKGDVIFITSAGTLGFKGNKKSTPFAASKVTDALMQVAASKGMQRIAVYVKGIGSGRDSALRSIGSRGVDIISIEDITPVAFNGPRPKKVRRV